MDNLTFIKSISAWFFSSLQVLSKILDCESRHWVSKLNYTLYSFVDKLFLLNLPVHVSLCERCHLSLDERKDSWLPLLHTPPPHPYSFAPAFDCLNTHVTRASLTCCLVHSNFAAYYAPAVLTVAFWQFWSLAGERQMVARMMRWDTDENSYDFWESSVDQAHISKFYYRRGISTPHLGKLKPRHRKTTCSKLYSLQKVWPTC